MVIFLFTIEADIIVESVREGIRIVGLLNIVLDKLVILLNSTNYNLILIICYNLILQDKNRDFFKNSIKQLLLPLLEYCKGEESNVSCILDIFNNLMDNNAKIYEEMNNCNLYSHVLPLLTIDYPSNQLIVSLLEFLYSLSHSLAVKESISKDTASILCNLLDADKLYIQYSHSVESIQISTLKLIISLCDSLHAKQIFGTSAVQVLLRYCKYPRTTQFDIYAWNMNVLELILEALSKLVLLDSNCKEFLREDNVLFQQPIEFICKILQRPDLFSHSVITKDIYLLSSLSHLSKMCLKTVFYLYISLDQMRTALGSAGIASLMKNSSIIKTNEEAILNLLNIFLNILTEDTSKQTYFEEGGMQFIQDLLQLKNEEINHSCVDLLSILSTHRFIRKVIRMLNIISKVLPMLIASKYMKSGLVFISNMSLDAEGQDQLMNELSFPSLIVNSLSSKHTEMHETTLSILEGLLNKRGTLNIF